MLQFRYFMLRLRITDEPAELTPRLTGVVERLGSGERRDFSSSEELMEVMETWDAELRPPQTTAGASEREPDASTPEAGNASTSLAISTNSPLDR